jgi:hypothetical protein
MKGKTRSLQIIYCALMKPSSGLLPLDHLTSETQSTPKRRWTTGLMRTGKQLRLLTNILLTIIFRLWNEENRDYEIKRA